MSARPGREPPRSSLHRDLPRPWTKDRPDRSVQEGLDISVRDGGEVELAGELDLATGPRLTASLEWILRRCGDVRIDLRGVTFMDLAGARALIFAARRLEGRGNLILRAPSAAVARLLDLSRADVFPNIEIMERPAP